MSREPLIMTARLIQKIRKVMLASIALAGLWLLITAFMALRSRMTSNDLADQLRMQRQTLAELRKAAVLPEEATAVELKSNDVLAKLQTDLEQKARSVNCKINEFQAGADRTPYMSAFSLETNRPEWEQIGVSLTLHGSLAATLSTIESLRSSGTPIEPDSMEISRQTVTDRGTAQVSVHLAFRVLVRAGGA